MSRYHGNDEICPRCALRYGHMRTGLTYGQVYEMLKSYSDDPCEWRYKRRGTVLGKWHQIKQEYWAWHLAECERQHAHMLTQTEPVPF